MPNKQKKQSTSWFVKHSIISYLLLSCGITWICWSIAIILSSNQGYLLPAQDVYTTFIQSGFSSTYHIFISVIFILGGFGPLFGAILVTRLESGKAGITDLLRQITKIRIGARWYLNAVLIAVAIAVIPLLLVILTPLGEFDSSSLVMLAPFILPILLWELLISFGEEPGWRGFLLPRLHVKFGGENYIWILGLIWAIWHYPFVIYHSIIPMVDVPVPVIAIGVVFSLAGYTMNLIGLTYLYVWLYNNTRSVFLAIVFHGFLNVASLVVFVSLSITDENPLVMLIIALMPWVIVIVLTKVLDKENFPGNPPTTHKNIY